MYPLPPENVLYVFTPENPCSLSNVIVAIPAVAVVNIVVIPVIFLPIPKSSTNESKLSLVKLFVRSLDTTSPIGALFANDFIGPGLSSGLSLSNSG